ncbi:MAG: signal peptidase I [Fibrobacter sp.]|nr:signal peptidase I [Fibrobacter sp.]
MKTPEKEMKKLLWDSSRKKILSLTAFLAFGFILALLVRFYVLEPYSIQDASMHPEFAEGKRFWVCKLPACTGNITRGDFVLAQKTNGTLTLRKVLGLPGDTVKFHNDNEVSVNSFSFHWEHENAFIAPRTVYIPRQGDTLRFADLSDVEFDYASRLYQMQNPGEKIKIEVTLYQGEKEIALEKVGNISIAGRPVSAREVQGLPWQELHFIELGLQKMEPGSRRFQIKRKIVSDSSEVSLFAVKEDTFFLICRKGNYCLDSRELGYFPKNKILGKVIR